MPGLPNDSRTTGASPFHLYVWPVLLAVLSATRALLYHAQNDDLVALLLAAAAASFVVAVGIRHRWLELSRYALVWGVAVGAAATAIQVFRNPPAGVPVALYAVFVLLAPIAVIALDGAMIQRAGASPAGAPSVSHP
jgi:hypothetical protein